jgi:hypothetical protein
VFFSQLPEIFTGDSSLFSFCSDILVFFSSMELRIPNTLPASGRLSFVSSLLSKFTITFVETSFIPAARVACWYCLVLLPAVVRLDKF